MTLEDCTQLLTPLALAMRVQMDVPTFRAYHRVLENVPTALAHMGLKALQDSGLRFFPTAPEIQAAAERSRRQQLALQQWEPCAECEDTPKWRALLIDGVSRLERCPCVERHKSLLATRGLLAPIAALPGEGTGESERVYPTVDQLPASIRAQVTAGAARKALRD